MVSYSLETENLAEIQTIAVTGLGAMGRGIAVACQHAGFRVWIHDCDPHAIERLLMDDAEVGPTRVRRNDIPGERIEAMLPFQTARSPADFADADLVIEAIPENLALKQSWLASIESVLRPESILATNTSSLTLESLTSSLKSPERVCGLHFCHPVADRKLVEVVRGRRSSATTIERTERFIHNLHKRPIVVGDAPGFVLNRLLSLYLNEALELLLEGVELHRLNKAALAFGFPTGPLQLLDQIGLHVAMAVGRSLYLAFPDRWVSSELLIAVFKAQKRAGTSESGFYRADTDRTDPDSVLELNACVQRIITERRRNSHISDDASIERRLWLPMLLEATRILDEQLIDSPQRIDTVLDLGLGMTPVYRGLFGWGDAHGAQTLLRWLDPLLCVGERFAPTPLLLAAAQGSRSLPSTAVRRQRAA